jgi:hypothetical protein
MKTAFYIVAFVFVSFFMDVFSFLLGTRIGGGSGDTTFVIMAISLFSGVVVCCTIYLGDQINKLNPNTITTESPGEKTEQDVK